MWIRVYNFPYYSWGPRRCCWNSPPDMTSQSWERASYALTLPEFQSIWKTKGQHFPCLCCLNVCRYVEYMGICLAHTWLQAVFFLNLFLPFLSELQSKAAWSRPKRLLIFSQPYNSPYLSITWQEKQYSILSFHYNCSKIVFDQMTDVDFIFSAMLMFEETYLSKIFNYMKLEPEAYFYCISIHLKIQQVMSPPSKV